MNDLQLSISITIAVFSSIVTVVLAIAPLYKKIGEIQGELQILKDKIYDICKRINDVEKYIYERYRGA